MYELVRTGHGSLEGLARVGLSREDLDLRISEAASRAGLATESLAQKLQSSKP
jgi:ribosome-binding protein aMBF1 (putative translation factor)